MAVAEPFDLQERDSHWRMESEGNQTERDGRRESYGGENGGEDLNAAEEEREEGENEGNMDERNGLKVNQESSRGHDNDYCGDDNDDDVDDIGNNGDDDDSGHWEVLNEMDTFKDYVFKDNTIKLNEGRVLDILIEEEIYTEEKKELEGQKGNDNDGDKHQSLIYEENKEDEGEEIEEEEEEEEAEEEDDDSEEDEEYIQRLFCSPNYQTEVLKALDELRHSSLLTDLTLSTEDGLNFHAHSPVLAAMSSVILQRLQEKDRDHEREISVCLGPQVSASGLAAVLEFAYTGEITSLRRETQSQIQAAALSLGIPRVLQLCKEEEEKERKGEEGRTGGKRRRISPAEQMTATLESIRQLWAERVGCDVELQIEGRLFHAHRAILVANSDYFRGMFTSGMRESKQSCVTLLSLRTTELEALLLYSYSGALAIGWGCIFKLTCTAQQLQFRHAFSLCLDFLQQEIDIYNCLDVVSFAEAYGMAELCEMAEDFVLRHFQGVSTTTKFQDLPVEKLKNYLQSHSLCVQSELPVFQAVVSWIEANPRKRVKLARELMGTIQFPLMTFKEFKEVKAVSSWPRCSDEILYESLLKEFCSSPSDAESQCRIYLPKDVLVLVGGEMISANFDNRYPSREIWFGNSFQNHIGIVKKVEWRMLGNLPEKTLFSHEVVVLNEKMYVVGGRHYYGKDDTLTSTYRYDPLQNSWQRLANMHERRSSFSLVVLDGGIYAIGGERDSMMNVESVEYYCTDTDSWSLVCPLDQALSGHAATVWGGKIFISGGFDCRYQCLVSMFLYHPEKGTTYLSDMRYSRAQHCMKSLGDHLYVVGGVSADATGLIDWLACEVYDPVGDTWSAMKSLPIPHVGAASAILEGRLYIIGGYCQEDYSESRLVHRYDPATQRWENMGKTPGPNTCIGACALCIPAHLRK